MSYQKIRFGKYNLIIEPLQGFSNAVFNARKTPSVDFDDLCEYLDKELLITHKRQNLNDVKGAGKRYWGELNEETIKKLEAIALTYNAESNLSVYSWTVCSKNTIYKTIDKTLRKDRETGIPKDIIDFFVPGGLKVGDKSNITLHVNNEEFMAVVMLKPDGRYKLKLSSIGDILNLSLLHDGKDTLWFERSYDDGFHVYTDSSIKSLSLKPNNLTKPLRTTARRESEYRVGQDYFRNQVIKACNGRCVVTGVEDTKLLIASHIKPWVESSGDEKMDGNNGLLLAPHVDKLFDIGQITFSDVGKIIMSEDLSASILDTWCIDINKEYSLNENQIKYMKYHRRLYKYES